MKEPLRDEEIAEIEERCARATPDSPRRHRDRYEHGGGRMWDAEPPEGGGRDLILDAFDEGNREFYFHARTDVPRLLAHVRALEAVREAAIPADAENIIANAIIQTSSVTPRAHTIDEEIEEAQFRARYILKALVMREADSDKILAAMRADDALLAAKAAIGKRAGGEGR